MLERLKSRKVLMVLAVLAAVAIAGGGYYAWSITPPPMPKTADEAVALLKSDRFQRLSDKQKRQYRDRIAEVIGPLDPEKRRELMRDRELRESGGGRDMMRAMMLQRATAYAQADPAERQDMITQAREQFGAMMRGRGGPRGEGDGQGNRPPSGEGEERQPREEMTEAEREARRAERREQWKSHIEQWVNEGNPQESALIREYFHALRDGWEDIPQRPPQESRPAS